MRPTDGQFMGSADKIPSLEPKVPSFLFLHSLGDPAWPPCMQVVSLFPESPDASMLRLR